MEHDYKTAILRGTVTGVIVSAIVMAFLFTFGGNLASNQEDLKKIISEHTKQEDIRFLQIINRLDQAANERAQITNNQMIILASQETLTARIIEMRTIREQHAK
jgi:hypothetical protein